MLPNLSALNVTGVNNASVFVDTPDANKEVATHHVGKSENSGALPCWYAVTRPDANAGNALQGTKFSLPCELYLLETNKPWVPGELWVKDGATYETLAPPPADDTVREVWHKTLPTCAQEGIDLSGLVRFNEGSRIELVLDTHTQVVHEFQVSIGVVMAQSEAGMKIAEHRFGLRGSYATGNEPIWRTPVYEAALGVGNPYDTARNRLKQIFSEARFGDDRHSMVQVKGKMSDPDGIYDDYYLKNWLPRLQTDVIFYYVECLTDRSYPPMVGVYALEPDPVMAKAQERQFPDAFKTWRSARAGKRGSPQMQPSVANDGDALRTAEQAMEQGYANGLLTCPAKNFLFSRANDHELARQGGPAYMEAEAAFARAKHGQKRHRSEEGPSAS